MMGLVLQLLLLAAEMAFCWPPFGGAAVSWCFLLIDPKLRSLVSQPRLRPLISAGVELWLEDFGTTSAV